MRTKEQVLLELGVSDVLLGLIHEQVKEDLYNNMTTSDLQGYTDVKAHEIISMIKKEIEDCGITKPGNSLRAVECLQKKGLI